MAQKLVLFALLVLFATSQVSALRCYMCRTENDEECRSNPKQEKFEANCDRPGGFLFSSLGLKLDSSVDHHLNEIGPKEFIVQCASATLTNITSGQSSLERGCAVKHINDESLKIMSLVHANIQVEKVRRCNSDLCNFRKL